MREEGRNTGDGEREGTGVCRPSSLAAGVLNSRFVWTRLVWSTKRGKEGKDSARKENRNERDGEEGSGDSGEI